MSEEVKKLLEDIRSAIAKIESFTEGITGFSQYQGDLKTKSAVERQLGIIGEATNKILQAAPEVQLNSAGQIIGQRNRIVHAYDSVDDSIIWVIIKSHLPKLNEEVRGLLG
jgi:uncharacterized protein with HEPN domain